MHTDTVKNSCLGTSLGFHQHKSGKKYHVHNDILSTPKTNVMVFEGK